MRAIASLALALLLAACVTTPPPTLGGADQAEIDRLGATLDAMHRFSARFVQSGDFGPGTGTLFVDRPGRLRIDYDGPGSRVLVASGGHLTVLDRATHAITTVSLSRTPLGLLLPQTIVVGGPVSVTALRHLGGTTVLDLVKTANPGQGTLRLAFSGAPQHLDAVTVIDAYRRALTMTLDQAGPLRPTPEMFTPPAS